MSPPRVIICIYIIKVEQLVIYKYLSMNKNILTGLLIMILVFSPFSFVKAEVTKVDSTKLSPSDQLDALSIALVGIGSAIATSVSISDTDRLVLMKQLVAISTQILQLRNGVVFKLPFVMTIATTTAAAESRKVTAKSVGLERVKVSYDILTNKSIVSTRYTAPAKNSTSTYDFTELNSVTGFTKKVALLRELAGMEVSSTTNIKFADVEDSLFLSAYETVRDNYIAPNSATAIYLADTFAKNSIVNRVEIHPGIDSGLIKIITDQGESLELILQKDEVDRDRPMAGSPTYSYTYSFYFPSPLDSTYDRETGLTTVIPKISQKSLSVTDVEVMKYIVTMFGRVPFTSQVPNFSNKLLSFLTNNRTYYSQRNSILPSTIGPDCYAPTDKLVVTEFIKYLVDNLEAQYEDPEKITQFISPLQQADEREMTGCMLTSRYF